MLSVRSLLSSCRLITRAYATAASPHALILLEHKDGAIESASLSALTAAQQLGGPVTGFVVGSPDQVPAVLERAKKYICFIWPTPYLSEAHFFSQAEGTLLGPAFRRSTVCLQSARNCLSTPREVAGPWFFIYPRRLCPFFLCQSPPSAPCGKARRSRRLGHNLCLP